MNTPETSSNLRHVLTRWLSARLPITTPRWDWRGWIAFGWVLWFGWLYSLMVLQTKFPQVLTWLRRVMAGSAGEQ